MQIKVLGGRERYIGYPESLCLSCARNTERCSFDKTRDMELCPDYRLVDEKQTRLGV